MIQEQLKDQQKKAREAIDKYDQEYSNAVYDQMEHFRTNPSNGNRYFEQVLDLAKKKYEAFLDTQIAEAFEAGMDELFIAIDKEFESFVIDEAVGKVLNKLRLSLLKEDK